MTLTEVRQAVADALSTNGYTVLPHAKKSVPGGRDGWVTVEQITPAGYGMVRVDLAVVLVLGAEPRTHDELFDAVAVPALTAIRAAELLSADVRVSPARLETIGGAIVYAAVVNLTVEV